MIFKDRSSQVFKFCIKKKGVNYKAEALSIFALMKRVVYVVSIVAYQDYQD